MAEVKAPNFTLDDLKNPAYWYRVGNQQKNVYAIAYNINGEPYTFLPTDYIQKGFRDGNTQYVDKNFLDKNTLDTIFNEGIGVDLESVAANWAVNGLKNTGFGTDGVLIPNSVLNKTNVMSGNTMSSPVNYRIDNSRTGGAVQGLTEYNGKYVYAQAPQGSGTNASYVDAGGTRRAEFTQRKGGLLGTLGGVLDDVLGIDPNGGGVFGSISSGLAQFEDIVREGVEGVDSALQNKYVRAVTKAVAAISPDPITRSIAIALDSYQTLDSGENLSPSQIVAIAGAGAQLSGVGTSGAEAGLEDLGFSTDVNPNAFAVDASGAIINTPTLTGVPNTVFDDVSFRLANSAAKISEGGDAKDILLSEFGGDLKAIDPEAFKAVNAGVRIAKGEDAGLVLLETYGEDVASQLGLKAAAEGAIVDNFGEDALQTLKDNKKIAQVGADILIGGKDPSEAVASRFADDIVELSGASTTNQEALVKAGLDTAVALDQGANTDDALLKGAETYIDEGGSVDLDIDADLLGDLSFEGEGVDFGGVGDILTSVGDTIADAAGPVKDILTEAGDIIAEGAAPIKEGVIAAGDVLADVGTAAGDVIADVAEPVKDAIIDLGDTINEGGAALDDLISENLPEIDIPELPALPELPEVALETPELPELPEVPELPSVQLPTLDLMKFAGLLGGLTALSGQQGGQAPKDELGRSAYATSPQFARGLDPLGTIGMFSRNKA